jgi:hypothetical protein
VFTECGGLAARQDPEWWRRFNGRCRRAATAAEAAACLAALVDQVMMFIESPLCRAAVPAL